MLIVQYFFSKPDVFRGCRIHLLVMNHLGDAESSSGRALDKENAPSMEMGHCLKLHMPKQLKEVHEALRSISSPVEDYYRFDYTEDACDITLLCGLEMRYRGSF